MKPRHVYVHVPFCARRCSYCDFSIAVRRATPVDEYLLALRTELDSAPRARIDTLYFGGGTPSRLGADGVTRMLDVIRERYTLAPDAEVTLEANPDDVTGEASAAWLAAGVNRLSIGAQSFDESVLRWMHRTHDAPAIARAVRTARGEGFDNISLDLIFALPVALRRDWPRDLNAALNLEPEHVSLYGLTVEPATPLARWRDRGVVTEAPEESYETEYLAADETLRAAGFDHYEVSNFGQPGRQSRHNAAYWQLVPYAGHGPAAHRFDGNERAWNEPVYSRWVERLRSGQDATVGRERLTGTERDLERVYLGLRTRDGLKIEPAWDEQVTSWRDAGWAGMKGGRVTLTPAGWLRLDALSSALTGHRSHCNV